MDNPKRGFVFRFDHYPMLSSLPMEQRGLLITALCVYADRAWQDTGTSIWDVADQFPQLSQETRMALAFMASVVGQDTRRWLEQKRACREAQARRAQGGSSSRSGQGGYDRRYGPSPSEAEEKRAAEDMARLQRMIAAEKETEKDRP